MNKIIHFFYKNNKLNYPKTFGFVFLINIIIFLTVFTIFSLSDAVQRNEKLLDQIQEYPTIKEKNYRLYELYSSVVISQDTITNYTHGAVMVKGKKHLLLEIWYEDRDPNYRLDTLVIIKKHDDPFDLMDYMRARYRKYYNNKLFF